MQDYRKYRHRPYLFLARQLQDDEKLLIGPEGNQHEVEAKAGQWAILGIDGNPWSVVSDEQFRQDYEPEALPEDQARHAENEPAPIPDTPPVENYYRATDAAQDVYAGPYPTGYTDEDWRREAERQGRERKSE